MNKVDKLNKQIDLCLKYWNDEIREEEFEENRIIHISEQVDNDMQKDRFY